jgi:hypothetical protein
MVFLVNVPIGIGALLLVMRSLHLPHTRRTTGSTGPARSH